jgi:type I restriction enzyme, R subunit
MTEELEWQTRRNRINKRLQGLNPAWAIVKYHPGLNSSALTHHAVEEYPTANGPADYALFVKGRFQGIIEAKKVGLSPYSILNKTNTLSEGRRTRAVLNGVVPGRAGPTHQNGRRDERK